MSKFNLLNVAEIELIYKNRIPAKDRLKVGKSTEAYQVFMNHWDENKIELVEQAKVLLLNRANQVLGLCDLSTGGVTGTIVDPRLVFVTALKANACSIILAHNHPSGNVKPSAADERLTEKLKEGGKVLDISVLDHLIVASDSYYSFSDELVYSSEELPPRSSTKALTS